MNSTREQREAREQARIIKEFNNNLKNSPSLLADELHLFYNMDICNLKLKQLPSNHLDNILLITKYFETPREFVNYKYIKPVILNDKLFLYKTIASNPDLYFIISNKNKEIFKPMVIGASRDYLKYLSNQDYDDEKIVKGICNNFSSFSESLSCLSTDNFKKLLSSENGKQVNMSLLSLSLENCQYLKNPLRNHLEELAPRNGGYWFNDLLNKNPYLYTVLDSEKYKDEKSKDFFISLVGKNNDLFTYLPKDWKQDLELVYKVMLDKSVKSNIHQKYGQNYHPNVKNCSLILNEYVNQEKFVKEKLNDKTTIHLRNFYSQLSLEWRSQESIIKSLFKERDNFQISLDYCRSVPDIGLADKLVSHLKDFKLKTLEHVGSTLEGVVSHHYLSKSILEKESSIKSSMIKI